ncbi:DNA-protecting protein DprA [Pedobacter yulinensis]|uniref:DNA-protecting protein DprA n=1 Tax=Pedobacter yulinensis TaxID=2126353 RepID=A0A2T3HHR2_9SPHI|nr:DNA-processing protein DprA [Pedobacter yulinensis]PST81970.1 DNA-protecting protein DprA [Pedobacter yulinensis]
MLHQLALGFTPYIGPVSTKALIRHCGTAEAVFRASSGQLLGIPGIHQRIVSGLKDPVIMKRAEEELKFIERHQVEVLFYGDRDYPGRLMNCCDAPPLLYYKGTADLNAPRLVAIVGTRKMTSYGQRLCEQLVADLGGYGVVTISGLAYGVDAAVHRTSVLQGIPTVGVLGHGLDTLYPRSHLDLSRKMACAGGLLTEFPTGTLPDRSNFPMRNRIIAGMADAVVVVEASKKGGALITADLANSYSRDVFAFPGRASDEFSEGCNFLIKSNRAALISSAADLIQALNWGSKEQVCATQISLPLALTDEERLVTECLSEGPLSVDALCCHLNMPQSRLSVLLLNLELQGILIALPGKSYRLA